MTNEEQLKIYAAYLPYDLSFENTVTHSIYRLKTINKRTDGFVRMEFSNAKISISDFIEDEDGNKMNFKPILYPLEYLTKEIEYEGRKFIPLHMLKNGGTDLNEYRFLEWKGYSVIDNEEHETCYCPETMSFYQFYRGDSRMCTRQYEKFQLLLKWKLNVFQLPEDQFINKATLTNK